MHYHEYRRRTIFFPRIFDEILMKNIQLAGQLATPKRRQKTVTVLILDQILGTFCSQNLNQNLKSETKSETKSKFCSISWYCCTHLDISTQRHSEALLFSFRLLRWILVNISNAINATSTYSIVTIMTFLAYLFSNLNRIGFLKM